jgi:ATP-dependent DNA helicase MPH1
MSSTDEDDYGDIADEDLIEALSQPSQTLPEHPQRRRRSRGSTGSGGSGDEGKAKKQKYKIAEGVDELPAARILGATQADGLPDSSPYRIRGPIYRRPRPEPPKPVPKPPLFSAASRHTAPQTKPPQINGSFAQANSLSEDEAFARELQDFPDDAINSSPDTAAPTRAVSIGSSPPRSPQSSMPRQGLVAPQTGLRQTTLFGGRAPDEVPASQVKKVYNFKVDKAPELPTHHSLNHDTLNTWVYPTNLGTIRDYQYTIVRNGLFNNLLVALPTGLGKTFIAATIMYNFFRWTRDAQIVFVAPTKPLVSQQVGACFNIVGLPRSATTMLTGDQAPALRAEEWGEKRVFFMTPQTLINDLSSGIADPKKIVLLVVDEAHRATGDYAYVKVVQFIRRFNQSFRILALTATPGSTVEQVQEVIDGLEISKVEIRTEESIDIRQFVHRRNIDQILLDPSDEIIMIRDHFSKALQPLANKLCAQNAYWNKDPMSFTTFGLIKAKQRWYMSDAGRKASQGMKGMMTSLFGVLGSVAHSIKLLNFHGIGPFYDSVKDFRQGVEDGNKGGKYRKQVTESPEFRKMMDRIQVWINKEDFIGHPKLTYLCDTIMNHFLDAGEGRLEDGAPPSSTRVIVFSEYRDSAEDIARVLNRHGPMIRASIFVGQADSKRSEGMNQQKQQDTINKFKRGIFNVIVATSIGEEGLDIGEVDLIVCYDASASPIRMLQRMGRTGRKRTGNIVLLLMRGKEEENFTKAKDNYEQMQKMISDGVRFNFRHDLSARIIPKEITPVVDKCLIDIPPENTQDASLPEPKRRASKLKKKPAKKFHMPDGVETGFRKASRIIENGGVLTDSAVTMKPKKIPKPKVELVPIPGLEDVFLSETDVMELERRYQNIAGTDFQEVSMPDMTAHTTAQRSLLPTVNIPHGLYTKSCVSLFKTLADSQTPEDQFVKPYGDEEPSISWTTPLLVEDESEACKTPGQFKKSTKKSTTTKVPAKRNSIQKRAMDILVDSDDGVEVPRPAKRQQVRKRAVSMSAEESYGELNGSVSRPSQISSEGPGDDLAESEKPSEDESDVGSLIDFVVQTGQPSTTRTIPSSRTATPSSPVRAKQKPYYEPVDFTATQDTDDLPDIDEIIGLNPKPKFRGPLADLDDDDITAECRPKKRRIVEDDSDE